MEREISLNEKFPKFISGFNIPSLAYFLSTLKEKQVLVITRTEEDAQVLADDINTFLNVFHPELKKETIFFPDLNKIEDLPLSKEIIGERLKVLIALAKGENIIVTASSVNGDSSPFTQMETVPIYFEDNLISLKTGDTLNISDFTDRIIKSGYEREYLVESRGKWSIRGGIIDIYAVELDYPVRIELEGDKIFSIRSFDTFTQRTGKIISSCRIFLGAKEDEKSNKNLLDYFKDKIIIIHEQQDRSLKKASNKIIYTSSLDMADEKEEKIKYSVSSTAHIRGNLNLLKEEVKTLVKDNFEIIFFSLNEGEKSRLIEIFNEIGIFNEINDASRIKFELGFLSSGFIWKDKKIAVFSDDEIFNRYKGRVKGSVPLFRMKKRTVPLRLADLVDMKPGDYVVHSDYGIGRFLGISRIEVDDSIRDFFTIEYLDNAKIHVPFYRLNVVGKYIGGDKEPAIDKLFSSRWPNQKERIKEKTKQIAKELIELYSAREVLPGYSFSTDTLWQKEFDASFIYEETEDQIKAIMEVKEDMEDSKPMDRLICGDVGYGKTEVAMRAAFKSVMDKKQVAVLAPTTILVEQHYNTFKERTADYPVNIEMLSRFRTKREQEKVLQNMQKGLVDIVIGTHRLLQKDIKFYDLGLVIVDEEQRFGVKAKETLKQLKKTVDVLTLTATPIPRTLHLALSGIKKISVINTPPEGRVPIETYCFAYNEKTIKSAIEREIKRNGQVFYLYNRIEDIEKKKEKLKILIPDAKISYAHGKMRSSELEKIMRKFIDKEFSILLSTTIIENGLDMPNVNTIIIENAHTFGLSELYQLRGRVGRGLKKAYAYITYPEYSALSLFAIERLKAIEECNEFGAGFKIALKDLEIRGAGNILGKEQHGDISKIGFDLYTQLLASAIQSEILVEEKDVKEEEPEISIKINAYVPDTYISNDKEKINTYRKIGAITSSTELKELKDEIVDIYGKIPIEVENLFKLIELKIIAKEKKIKLIKETEKNILVEYSNGRKINYPLPIKDLSKFLSQ